MQFIALLKEEWEYNFADLISVDLLLQHQSYKKFILLNKS